MNEILFPRQRWIYCLVTAAILVAAAAAPVSAQSSAPVPGEFLGADLITEDAANSAAFYSELLGWDVEKIEDGEYAMFHKGRLIASVSSIEKSADVSRSFWLVGIAVADVDDALRGATALGSKVHEQARTVGDYGRIAVIGDPHGAPLMLIEPGKERIGGTTGPGSWAWAEFWTDSPKSSAAFYEMVIGYETKTVDRDGQPYGVFVAGGKGRTGLVEIPEEFENVRPGWAPYVGVTDLPKVMADVKRLGGRVVIGAQESTGAQVALILDPAGAALFLYEIGTHQGAN